MAIFTAIGTSIATGVLGAAAAGTAGFTFLSRKTITQIKKVSLNERC